jgi:hypothetical protein
MNGNQNDYVEPVFNLKNGKKKLERWGKTPFFSFAKPYFDFVEKGKLFYFFYVLMAIVNIVIPFFAVYKAVDSGVFDYSGAKFTLAFIFAWIFIVFACWTGFQLWWDRKSKIVLLEESDFIATPVFSHLIQTFGEWLGTLTGIIGLGAGLVATIFLGDEAGYLFQAIGLNSFAIGGAVIVVGPVAGFLIIILSRFIAEQLRLFASLVNNTREIAINLKKGPEKTAEIPEQDVSGISRSRVLNPFVPTHRVKFLADIGGLSLRREPVPSSAAFTKIPNGTDVQHTNTGGIVKLRGEEALWYEIITKDGIRGWCFSGGLEKR